MRQKERELRRLMALVSSQDDEVIIVNESAEGDGPAHGAIFAKSLAAGRVQLEEG